MPATHLDPKQAQATWVPTHPESDTHNYTTTQSDPDTQIQMYTHRHITIYLQYTQAHIDPDTNLATQILLDGPPP